MSASILNSKNADPPLEVTTQHNAFDTQQRQFRIYVISSLQRGRASLILLWKRYSSGEREIVANAARGAAVTLIKYICQSRAKRVRKPHLEILL
jgi:hypothetical protein